MIANSRRLRRLLGMVFVIVTGGVVSSLLLGAQGAAGPVRFPSNQARGVSPDTHLTLVFDTLPARGDAGRITIADARTGNVVDTIDLAIPDGPAAAPAAGSAGPYQTTVVGGFAEGFHFHPVIVHGHVVTISPHQHVLAYGRTYRVTIDSGAIVASGFRGLTGAAAWTFTTRPQPPAGRDRLVVDADGSGDFATVQGAIDAIPDRNPRRTTVFIRSGLYEEIVYFRRKANITFLGEDRSRVVIGYANSERFNGPPPGVATNEKPGTFPYRRAAFMADESTGIEIRNLTIENFTPVGGGQAEALILAGGRNLVSGVNLFGHQDTAQFNDSVYVENSTIQGDTDFLWGRGPAFFRHCQLRELANGPFMWVRSTAASHGFVFDRCTFEAPNASAPGAVLARNTAAYPDSEVVLLECLLAGVSPAAWSLPADAADMHYWEFRSMKADGGGPVDVSGRHAASRQLDEVADRTTIAQYRDPAYVLGDWSPNP